MAAWREKREREKERAIVYMFEKVNVAEERGREGERKAERLRPIQKRVKLVGVACESESGDGLHV